MKFTKFSVAKEWDKRPSPIRMLCGQVVVRRNIKKTYAHLLNFRLRQATHIGMEFSVAKGAKFYAIRRDK